MPIKTLTVHSFRWTNGRGHNQKPLLYSVKNNTNGLGHSVHSVHSDQWWENAFDKQLKGLQVDDTKGGVSLQATAVSLKSQILFGEGRWMNFIPGGILGGSMGAHDALVAKKVEAPVDKTEAEKMRKREERAKRKLEKLQKKDASAARKKRREERAQRREKRAKRKEKKLRKERKEGKKKEKK